MRRLGGNKYQYSWKLNQGVRESIITVLAFMFFGFWLIEKTRPAIVSPLPDNPVVYASEPEIIITTQEQSIGFLTTREKLLIKGFRFFGEDHLMSLDSLIFKESSWNQYAINPSSGACGLFQSFPCNKMKCDLSDVDCQITWGLNYIKSRYGNPTNAWSFWQKHHWY